MTGPPRDWDKELAEIDKIMAKQPAAPAGKPAPAGAAAPVAAQSGGGAPAPAGRKAALTTWIRVALGVAVAIGVTQWPYQHACGMKLYGYLAAAGGVMLAGLWGVVTSWKRRIPLAHFLSLLVTLWGALLIGKSVLDRSSYPKSPSSWSCS